MLTSVRTDDLAAFTISELMHHRARVDLSRLDEVAPGCADQSAEGDRNAAWTAALLAGLLAEVPALTVNGLCAGGVDSIEVATRGDRPGDCDPVVAETTSRAQFDLPKARSAFSRVREVFCTTIAWGFMNLKIDSARGTHSMPETADSVTDVFRVSRSDQDCFAAGSQGRRVAAHKAGFYGDEIVPIHVPQRKGSAAAVKEAANPISSDTGGGNQELTPVTRVVGKSSAGVLTCAMGVRPAPARHELLDRAGSSTDQIDVIEIDEAFASQGLATLRQLGVADDGERGCHRAGASARHDWLTDCSDGSPVDAANLRNLCSEHDVRWPWAGYSRYPGMCLRRRIEICTPK